MEPLPEFALNVRSRLKTVSEMIVNARVLAPVPIVFYARENLPTTTLYPTKDSDGNPLETEYGLCRFKDHQTVTIQVHSRRGFSIGREFTGAGRILFAFHSFSMHGVFYTNTCKATMSTISASCSCAVSLLRVCFCDSSSYIYFGAQVARRGSRCRRLPPVGGKYATTMCARRSWKFDSNFHLGICHYR